MDWGVVGQIAFGSVAAAATLFELGDRRQARSRRRRQVLTDLDILDRLPEQSSARSGLQSFIDETVEATIEDETEKQRSGIGIGIAVVILAGALSVGRQVFVSDYPLAVDFVLFAVAIFLLLLGVVGLQQSAIRERRDAKGRIIKSG